MKKDYLAFSRTAEEFCAIIENAEGLHRIEFAALCFRLLSKLLVQVSELPGVPLQTKAHLTGNAEYGRIVSALKSVMGDKEYYRMVFDPFEGDDQVVYGSLSDDLSDIWSDLKGGLEAYRSGNIDEACGEWRFTFAYHWGPHHATHALTPLLSIMLEGGWYDKDE